MKKTLAVLSAVALFSSLLAGCGGDKKETGAASTPAANKEPVTLKLHSWYKEADGNWNATVDAFNKTHPGIKVVYEPLVDNGNSTEAMKKLDLLAASGDQLDIIMINAAVPYAQRVGAGMLEPLEKYIEKSGIKPKEDFKVDTSLNGKYYALPGKYIEWLILMNKDLLDKAGLKVPTEWTWNEYAEYAKKMTAGEGAQKSYGSYFHNWKDYSLLALMNEPEVPYIVKEDGSPNVDNPRVRYSLELRNKMENVDKSSVPYFEVVSQKLNYRDVYYAAKAAMLPTGNWMINELSLNSKFKTVFAPYPKYDAKDPNGLTEVGADFMGIAASSKNKDAAWEFVKWYTTEGIVSQGSFFSSYKKADPEKNLDAILKNGKPGVVEMVDKASLLNVLKTSKATKLIVPPTYAGQMEQEFLTQVELFLSGKQDLEKTIKTAESKMAAIKSSNK